VNPTSESIKAAQANYEQSKAQLDLLVSGSTEQTLNAAKADLDQAYAVLEQQKLVLSKYKIKAPADGTYISRSVSIGDIISPGTNVGTISDLSDLWVNVFIPRRHLERVSLDQEIMLSSSGISIKGKITYIASEAEFTPKNVETSEAKENMVFKVKIKILDNIERLKPGMTTDVQL
jgi:HlyD family secretion protein